MDPKDFEKLCRSIDKTVSVIAKSVGRGLGEAGGSLGDTIGQAIKGYQQGQTKAAEKSAAKERMARLQARFKPSGGFTAIGAVMAGLGAMSLLTFGGSFIFALPMVLAIQSTELVIGEITVGALAAFSGILTAFGVRRMRAASQERAFGRIFGQREVCTFAELAAQLHLPEKKVVGQARKMLAYGLLPEGHIDDDETCLMVTDAAYGQYRSMQERQRRELAQQQAQRTARQQSVPGELSPAARAFIEQGNDYLRQMRELDVAIDDEAVSAKIVAIEGVMEQILRRVAEEPQVMDCLGRLMDYYLPTTVKLLAAYDDLEDQEVQGETIAQSRRDIEQTLDVLLGAYQKLLDSTFQDLSMDVSSDISVLHAVLAQEGLTDSPFDPKK